MKIKTSNLKRVQPKDYDAALLEELCREGRLYVYTEPVEDVDMCRREVLDYVRRIRDFAAESWKAKIDSLWNTIVEEPCFKECLMMKNGIQRGHINRYSVTNIVCRLQNAGVYRQDVSMLELHLRLEGIGQKNKYYRCSANYDLSRDARVVLRKLLQRV